MSDDTTQVTICPVHNRLDERIEQLTTRLWKTRHWLIYIAFISFVGSFLGAYAGKQMSIVEALVERDGAELEHEQLLEQKEQETEIAGPLVAGRP